MKTLEEDSEAWNLLTSYPFGHQQENVDRLSKKAFECYDAFGLHQQGRKNHFNAFNGLGNLICLHLLVVLVRWDLLKRLTSLIFKCFSPRGFGCLFNVSNKGHISFIKLRNTISLNLKFLSRKFGDAFSKFQKRHTSALLNQEFYLC